MAPDLRRRVAVASALAAIAVNLLPIRAHAAAWWAPLAFAGQRVDSVATVGGLLTARVGAIAYVSADGGQTFALARAAPSSARPPAAVVSAGRTWTVSAGTVLSGATAAGLHPDPRAPFLGAGATLIAAPAALPGVVVAVATDGHVWRRGQDGGWATAFVPLPAGGFSGSPRITGVEAFTQPLSDAVYLGTEGYGVLLSNDGGDDWIRADPGLPDNVLGLATDPGARALYAATDSGLWVHELQALPSPPAYQDAQLWLRWLGIAAVALVASLLAGITLVASVPSRRRDP